MRVNELAKELGKTSKEVLEILQKQNQDVKSHSSNINEDQIQMVRRAAKPAANAETKSVSGGKSGMEAKPAAVPQAESVRRRQAWELQKLG